MPLKLLHFRQSAITVTMDSSSLGLWILSIRAILIAFQCQCLLFMCSSCARSFASSFVTHSHHALAQVPVMLFICHSLLSSIIYSMVWCHTCFLSWSDLP